MDIKRIINSINKEKESFPNLKVLLALNDKESVNISASNLKSHCLQYAFSHSATWILDALQVADNYVD